MLGAYFVQVSKNLLLQIQIFNSCLYYQVAVGKGLEVRCAFDTGQRSVFIFLSYFFLLNTFGEGFVDYHQAFIQKLLFDFRNHYLVACLRANLHYASAHLPATYNAYFLDCHSLTSAII